MGGFKLIKRFLIFLYLILLAVQFPVGVVYNYTPSEPLGFYLEYTFDRVYPGDIYLICPPENKEFMRGVYFGWVRKDKNSICGDGNVPLVKANAATPFEKVVINKSGVYVNNRRLKNSKPLKYVPDTHISMLRKRYNLDRIDGYFFVSTYNKYSFDSRYWGAISRNDIKYRLVFVGGK